MQRNSIRLWLLVALLWWFTHALSYLFHEYAHSFSAWALGHKANPLILVWGQLTPQNIAFLLGVDENVDYDRIFAAGKGYRASLI